MEFMILLGICVLIVGGVALRRGRRRRPAVDDPHLAAVTRAEAQRKRDIYEFPGGL
jgi:hypothetical protein